MFHIDCQLLQNSRSFLAFCVEQDSEAKYEPVQQCVPIYAKYKNGSIFPRLWNWQFLFTV